MYLNAANTIEYLYLTKDMSNVYTVNDSVCL